MKLWGRRDTSGVPAAWVKALERRFHDDSAPRRTKEIVDYVLMGGSQHVLAQAGRHYWYGPDRDPSGLYALDELPAEVALRFARVLAAESSFGGRSALLANAEWVYALVSRMPLTAARSVSIATLENMFVAAGLPAELAMTPTFSDVPSGTYSNGQFDLNIRSMRGYAEAVQRHADAIRATIGVSTANGRTAAGYMLAGLPDDVLALFADEVAELSCTTSAKVRKVSAPLVERLGAQAVEPLRAIAAEGAPAARVHAYRQLHEVGDAEVRAWAVNAAGKDRAASVRALVADWSETAAAPVEPEEPMQVVVETPAIDWRVMVTPELRATLAAAYAETNRRTAKDNESLKRHSEEYRAQHGSVPDWLRERPLLPKHWVDDVVAALQAGKPPRVKKAEWRGHHLVEVLRSHAAAMGRLGAPGLLILLDVHGDLWAHGPHRISTEAVELINEVHDATGRPTLLELSTALDQTGVDGAKAVLNEYAVSWRVQLAAGWPAEHLAPFAAARLDAVLALLDADSYDYDRTAAYSLLATVPALPRKVVNDLFGRAVGTRKTERRPAQDALARVPGIADRVTRALEDGKGEVRAEAAGWLQRLDHTYGLPALEAAISKEKQDVAAGAILDALESFGQPVEKYLDRDGLRAQADKLLAKGLPKDMSWFPVAGLPDVRWADSGETIPREVLTWFIAQAVKAKSPEPRAILRKYAGMFESRGRERFGQFVLESWVAQDLQPVDPDDARREAAQSAQWIYSSEQRYPDPQSPYAGKNVAELTTMLLPNHLKQPRGSATASKGMLAVAGACAGERAAGVAERYLKEWYGQRAAQGKALIAMLAWIDHPSATQLVLSIGSRFRTKSFQEDATRQAEALAERKGWTVAELADRTIPTGGFDETGTLELSYGERVFAARLMPDLSVVLRDPDGKPIKSLPPPRKTDDEDRAKESKKTYQAAKKELKAVATLQTARLYEALCTERSWPYDDWSRYLNRHPVLRYSTQRLAWLAIADDGARQVFRPLDDGTLTDVDDNEVTVADGARMAVAHDSNLTSEQIAAWAEHFDDYEVTPLFQQFGKGRFELSEKRRREKAVDEFRGHLVETFALRSRAAKLGYTRGPAEDGGWFMTYVKRFPTLGVEAVVEFTGNPLPETNRTVALLDLSFAKVGERGRSVLRLGDVPAVLLSECYHDQRLMAADGPGFDPEWEKKSEYR